MEIGHDGNRPIPRENHREADPSGAPVADAFRLELECEHAQARTDYEAALAEARVQLRAQLDRMVVAALPLGEAAGDAPSRAAFDGSAGAVNAAQSLAPLLLNDLTLAVGIGELLSTLTSSPEAHRELLTASFTRLRRAANILHWFQRHVIWKSSKPRSALF